MLCFVALFLFIFNCVFSSDLPVNFPKCDLNDPELDNCILKATEDLRPQIRKGIEKVNIPAFGPLSDVTFGANQDSQLLNYTATLSHCTVEGLDNYKFQEIRYNSKSMTFNGSVQFDLITFNCIYAANARVLSYPVIGKGNAHMDFVTCKATFEVVGKMKTRKGIDYYYPTSTKILGTIDDGHFHFTGLFDGNKELGRLTNNMLNQNAKVLVQAVTPAIEKLAEQTLMRMMKSFTKTIPYSELFTQLN